MVSLVSAARSQRQVSRPDMVKLRSDAVFIDVTLRRKHQQRELGTVCFFERMAADQTTFMTGQPTIWSMTESNAFKTKLGMLDNSAKCFHGNGACVACMIDRDLALHRTQETINYNVALNVFINPGCWTDKLLIDRDCGHSALDGADDHIWIPHLVKQHVEEDESEPDEQPSRGASSPVVPLSFEVEPELLERYRSSAVSSVSGRGYGSPSSSRVPLLPAVEQSPEYERWNMVTMALLRQRIEQTVADIEAREEAREETLASVSSPQSAACFLQSSPIMSTASPSPILNPRALAFVPEVGQASQEELRVVRLRRYLALPPTPELSQESNVSSSCSSDSGRLRANAPVFVPASSTASSSGVSGIEGIFLDDTSSVDNEGVPVYSQSSEESVEEEEEEDEESASPPHFAWRVPSPTPGEEIFARPEMRDLLKRLNPDEE